MTGKPNQRLPWYLKEDKIYKILYSKHGSSLVLFPEKIDWMYLSNLDLNLLIILEEINNTISNRIKHIWFLHYYNTANNTQFHTLLQLPLTRD